VPGAPWEKSPSKVIFSFIIKEEYNLNIDLLAKNVMTAQEKSVLILEDDVFLVKAYKSRFDKENIRLVIVKNGKLGLAEAKQNKPDVILLDLVMPDGNGFEFLEELKTLPGFENIAVIVLTNLGGEIDRKHALKLGASEYMVKADSSMDEVIEMVKKYL